MKQIKYALKNIIYFEESYDLENLDFLNKENPISIGEETFIKPYKSILDYKHHQKILDKTLEKFPNTPIIIRDNGEKFSYSYLNRTKNLFINLKIGSFKNKTRKELGFDKLGNIEDILVNSFDKINLIYFIYNGNIIEFKNDIDLLFSLNEKYKEKIAYLDFSNLNDYEEAVRVFDNAFINPYYLIKNLKNFPITKKINTDGYFYNKENAENIIRMQVIDSINLIKKKEIIDESEVALVLPDFSFDFVEKEFKNTNINLIKIEESGSMGSMNFFVSDRSDFLNAILKKDKFKYYIMHKENFNSWFRDYNNFHAEFDYPTNIILF